VTIATQKVYDCTRVNINQVPHDGSLLAGYTTGSGEIPWGSADWAAHPGAVRICQDAGATDHTADVLDVEQGAATNGSSPGWVKLALSSYRNATRPGQRSPAIYTSRNNVTPLVNALIAGGVSDGVGLWVADWNNNQAEATAEVVNASGPFPIIGRQYHNAGPYDVSVFSSPWLATVSKKTPPPVKFQVPPGQWNDPHAWTWASGVTLTGLGLDGKVHLFRLNTTTGAWERQS